MASASIAHLSAAQLRRAAGLREKIEALEQELGQIVGEADAVGSVSAAGKPARRKPKISAAGRARIAAAQRARWAKVKAAKA